MSASNCVLSVAFSSASTIFIMIVTALVSDLLFQLFLLFLSPFTFFTGAKTVEDTVWQAVERLQQK
jgi:hypothetical protein